MSTDSIYKTPLTPAGGNHVLFVEGGNPANPTIDPKRHFKQLKNKKMVVLHVNSLKIPLFHMADNDCGLMYGASEGHTQIILMPHCQALS